jgi:hypothetical protein
MPLLRAGLPRRPEGCAGAPRLFAPFSTRGRRNERETPNRFEAAGESMMAAPVSAVRDQLTSPYGLPRTRPNQKSRCLTPRGASNPLHRARLWDFCGAYVRASDTLGSADHRRAVRFTRAVGADGVRTGLNAAPARQAALETV